MTRKRGRNQATSVRTTRVRTGQWLNLEKNDDGHIDFSAGQFGIEVNRVYRDEAPDLSALW
jgi:hypothetical protein